ncbi:actin family [Entophlyctis helioformis]|nr:actin family [Entophlyctis helioformis]
MVQFGGDEVSALVFDIGSRLSKVGYAGEELPKGVFSSYVGTDTSAPSTDMDVDQPSTDAPTTTSTAAAAADKAADKAARRRRYVGDVDIFRWRAHMALTSPMDADGVVSDWDALEALWDYAYHGCLRADPAEHPLMFAEPSWNPREKREKLCELAFEKYNAPAFYLGRSAVLSAFASGRSTALVVDSGASMTSVVPVQDGYVLKKGIQRTPLGGDFVSSQVQLALERMGIDIVPQYLVEIKQVSDPAAPAIYTRAHRPDTGAGFHEFAVERVMHEFKESIVHVSEQPFDERAYRKRPQKRYEFPNGYNQSFGAERFRFAEGLFQTDFIAKSQTQTTDAAAEAATPAAAPPKSIPQMIHASVGQLDIDIRQVLCQNVVLTGGNSLLPGFSDRLYVSLHHEMPQTRGVKVIAAGGSSERRFGPWIGGSILASLGSFHQLWISKQQYEEIGSSVEKRIH